MVTATADGFVGTPDSQESIGEALQQGLNHSAAAQFLEQHGQEAAPAPVQPLADGEALELVSSFSGGLTVVHRDWRAPLAQAFDCLLPRLVRLEEDGRYPAQAAMMALAFMLLPGLVSYIGVRRRRHMDGGDSIRQVDFLRTVAASAQPWAVIIRQAQAWRGEVMTAREQAGERPLRPFSETREAKTIELTVQQGYLSSAMARTEMMQRSMQGARRAEAALSVDARREIVGQLHPQGTERDQLPDPDEEEPPALWVDEDAMAQVICGLSTDSAQGMTGWTNALIKLLTLKEGSLKDREARVILITAWANLVYAGKVSAQVRDIMVMGRVVLLPKDDGGYRPLGIGDSWLRLFHRAASKAVSGEVGKKLKTHQLAVGLPGGCQIGAMLAQLQYHRNDELPEERAHAVVLLDATNAFNTVHRAAIYEGLQEFCPGLVRLFRWAYGVPSQLRHSNGELLGLSERGCRQGDPLGMLFFCVAFQTVLVQLGKELRRDEDAVTREFGGPRAPLLPEEQRGAVKAFADDACILTDHKVAKRLEPKIADAFARVGLQYNRDKCKIIGPQLGVRSPDERPGLRLAEAGAMVLGCPVGHDGYVQREVGRIARQAFPPTEAMALLHPMYAFRLLVQCVNARPAYLASVCPLHLAKHALGEFDEAVTDTMRQLAHGRPEDKKRIELLRGLPQEMGGLGVRCYKGPETEVSALITRRRTWDYMKDEEAPMHLQALRDCFKNPQNMAAPVIGALSGKEIREVYDETLTDEKPLPEMYKWLGEAKATVHTRILREDLVEAQDWSAGGTPAEGMARVQTLAQLRNQAFAKSSRWTTAPQRTGTEGWRLGTAPPGVFRNALRLWLLLPAAPAAGGRLFQCRACGPLATNYASLELHAVTQCRSAGMYRKVLHDALRNAVAQSMRKIFESREHTVALEYDIAAEGQGEVKVDVRVEASEKVWNLDVTVVNPISYGVASQRAQEAQARREVAAAAGEEEAGEDRQAALVNERRKRQHYTGRAKPDEVVRLRPLVVEMTGRLGPAFEQFLKEIGVAAGINDRPQPGLSYLGWRLHRNGVARAIALLRADISLIVARFNGYKILATRGRQAPHRGA